MAVYEYFKIHYSRIHDLVLFRRRKEKRPQISSPFNFRREDSILPGVSDDEMSVLREQAIASRIAVADEYPGIPHSRTAPPRPLLPGDALSSSPSHLSSSPVSPSSLHGSML